MILLQLTVLAHRKHAADSRTLTLWIIKMIHVSWLHFGVLALRQYEPLNVSVHVVFEAIFWTKDSFISSLEMLRLKKNFI